MDFQAPNPAPEKASAFPNNEILVKTSNGVLYLTLPDSVSSNLNLSAEDLSTVAEQLLTENEAGSSFNTTSFSDATTVDSDDPVSSDCSLIKQHLILPPSDVRPLQHTRLSDMKSKLRGGWPKGRKRKPEVLNLPPKAPASGYNLYLNEMRTHFKNSGLMFYEITKLVGNQWSNLSLDEKEPYLMRAEMDKRRYRDELRKYRQSGSYQLYLAKKRIKRSLNNAMSESDMDATDDIDDEDNEELYCRTCDQWFHNLHNKREHLLSRIHHHALIGDIRSELDSDTDTVVTTKPSKPQPPLKSVADIMADLNLAVCRREKDLSNLHMLILEGEAVGLALSQQLLSLQEREARLRSELSAWKKAEKELETMIFALWKVPCLFITTDWSSNDIEPSEYYVPDPNY